MKEYFLHDGNEQKGPYSIEELKKKNITKETMLWCEGVDNWQKAENFKEINDELFSKIPPPLKIKKQSEPKEVIYKEDIKKKKSKRFYIIIASVAFFIIVLIIAFLSFNNFSSSDKEVSNQPKNNLNIIDDANTNAEVIAHQEAEAAATAAAEEARLAAEAAKLAQDEQKKLDKLDFKNNWTKYVTVERNTYYYKEIGGISNLKITVTNNSIYKIDNIVVLVNYLKKDGSIFTREFIAFDNISSNSTQTRKAPDSNRGTSISYSIYYLYCKVANLTYSI